MQDDAIFSKTLLTTDEAAHMLHVTPRTIRRYMHNGLLEYTRTPGGHRKVIAASLKIYLDKADKQGLEVLTD